MYKILLLLYVVRLAEEKLYAIPVPASRGRPHRRGLQQTSSSAEPPQPRPRHPPGTELAATFLAGNCELSFGSHSYLRFVHRQLNLSSHSIRERQHYPKNWRNSAIKQLIICGNPVISRPCSSGIIK